MIFKSLRKYSWKKPSQYIYPLLFMCFIVISLVNAPLVGAFFLDNVLNSAKNIIAPDSPKLEQNQLSSTFSIDSTITLVPDGDVNKNGEIDAGDIVRFNYTLTNTTDKVYSYATLKTNINRKQLNFIHSLRGATGLTDEKDTIVFRNIRLGPNEQRIISFDARVNYSEEDKIVTSEPEFISSDNKPIGKFQKKEITAKKLTKEEIKKRLENRGMILKNIRSNQQ